MQHVSGLSARPSCGAKPWLLVSAAVSPFTSAAVFVGLSLYWGVESSLLLLGATLVVVGATSTFLAFKLVRLSVTDTELVHRGVFGLVTKRLPISSITEIAMVEERAGSGEGRSGSWRSRRVTRGPGSGPRRTCWTSGRWRRCWAGSWR